MLLMRFVGPRAGSPPRALRPFLLRRTKDQVLPELPPRTEHVLDCELDADQRRHYDALLAHYRAALLPRVARDGMARSTMHVPEALLRLRQAACHPALIDARYERAASAKLDTLIEHLAEAPRRNTSMATPVIARKR